MWCGLVSNYDVEIICFIESKEQLYLHSILAGLIVAIYHSGWIVNNTSDQFYSRDPMFMVGCSQYINMFYEMTIN